MRVEAFRVEDVARLKNHGGQESLVSALPVEELARLTAGGGSWSYYQGNELVACMGVVKVNPWRGVAWALLQDGLPKTFLGVTRCARFTLQTSKCFVVETYTDPHDQNAARWVRLLGFELITPFKRYFFPDGRPASVWELTVRG